MTSFKMTNRTFLLSAWVFVIALFSADSLLAQPVDQLRLGVVLDADHPMLSGRIEGLRDQVQELVGTKVQVSVQPQSILKGDRTVDKATEQLRALLSEPQVDLVVAFGPIASAAAIRLEKVDKPLVAPFVMDPRVQRAPLTADGTSGVPNLSYLLNAPSFLESLVQFRKMSRIKNIAVITDQSVGVGDAQEQERLLSALATSEGVGVTVVPYAQRDRLSEIKELDGVFVYPLFEVSDAERGQLYAAVAQMKLPCFAWGGVDEVERGALTSFTDRVDFARLNRRIGLNVVKLTEGRDFGGMPVGFVESGHVSINMVVAQQVGYQPSTSLLEQARLIPEAIPGTQEALTLKDAVVIALKSNLDYLANQSDIAARGQDYWTAWTHYFPQISLSGSFTTIDKDTVEGMRGLIAQHSLFGGVMGQQILMSHKAIAAISIQSSLEDQREAELEQIKQDICLLSALAYLDVQKRAADLQIFKKNLAVTDYNLAVARRRRALGLTGASEVYRWESQQALDERQVIGGQADLDAAYMLLNQILHRPMLDRYQTPGNVLLVEEEFSYDQRWDELTESPSKVDEFKVYLADRGVETSFVTKQFNATIEAKRKQRRDTYRGYYWPDLGISGTINQRFWRGGAEGVPPISEAPERLDTYWAVGANLTWDIFEGGAKATEHKKFTLEEGTLELEKQSFDTQLRQQIHTAFTSLTASIKGVKLAKVSAEAAAKNLDIATEAYALGTITLERLVDAQRQAFNANQNVAGARYLMKRDQLTLVRSVNLIVTFIDDEQFGPLLFQEFESKHGNSAP